MDVRPDAIVVGVDGSPSSALAADWAAAEAHLRGCPLEVVNALPPAWVPIDPELLPMSETAELTRPAFLDETAERVSTAWPDLEVATHHVIGTPAFALLTAGEAAALLVVGSRGRSFPTRMLLGSVSRHVATQSHCPTVVVRASAAPGPTPVAVGIDDSPTARAALAAACVEASQRGVGLLVVHAWHDLDQTGYAAWTTTPSTREERRKAAERLARDAVSEVATTFPDLEVVIRVRQAHPVDAVVAVSHEVQLLVLGAHGRGAFPGMTVGSVCSSAIQHAECPVMIVPAAGSGS
jgi:nucleotide-binding universal stress UspA family protein